MSPRAQLELSTPSKAGREETHAKTATKDFYVQKAAGTRRSVQWAITVQWLQDFRAQKLLVQLGLIQGRRQGCPAYRVAEYVQAACIVTRKPLPLPNFVRQGHTTQFLAQLLKTTACLVLQVMPVREPA